MRFLPNSYLEWVLRATYRASEGIAKRICSLMLFESTQSWGLSLFLPAIIMYLIGAVVFGTMVNANVFDFDSGKPVEALA